MIEEKAMITENMRKWLRKKSNYFPQIPVLLNLPGVGQNLQDHFNVHGLSWTVPKGALGSPNMFSAALQYFSSRTGRWVRSAAGVGWAQNVGHAPPHTRPSLLATVWAWDVT